MGKASRRVSLEKVVARMSGGEQATHRAPTRREVPPDVSAKALAQTLEPRKRSVHLRLEPEVLELFDAESEGQGHEARMEAVLRAYANIAKGKLG